MIRNVKPANTVWIALALVIAAWLGLSIALHQIFIDNTIGIDFCIHWNAGRMVFLEHGNPYTPELGLRNQFAIYGRAARGSEDPYQFPYPLYILIPPAPLFLLSFDWAQAIFMALNLLGLLVFGPLLFQKKPLWIPLTFMLFYEVYFTLFVGNYALTLMVRSNFDGV